MAFVLGLLSFVFLIVASVPAIIVGVKAKKAVDNSGGTKTGRGLATAGEVLGIVTAALSVIVIPLIIVGVVAATKHTPYNDLQAGDCYTRVSSGSIFSGEVNKVDCSKPHDAEVTGSFQATDPGSYPGDAGFRTQAQPQCLSLGRQYLGTTSGAGLDAIWLYPKQAAWDDGTRTVVCGIQNADGSQHTGSVRG